MTPSRSMRRPRLGSVLAALAIIASVVLALVVAPRAGAQGDGEPGPIAVTQVDATSDMVEAFVAGVTSSAGADDVTISDADGESIDVSAVATSQRQDRPTEIVVIVDTNARSAQGDILGQVKTALTAAVGDLSPATSIAIVSAGDSALIETRLTSNREQVLAAIDDLGSKNGSAIYNAIDRAGTLFSEDVGVVRSVIVFSTGRDTSSDVSLDRAQVGIVQRGAQLVSVRWDGGASALTSTVERTSGFELSVDERSGIAASLDDAVVLASDRLIVSFAGTVEAASRGNVTIDVGDASTAFSYPAGVVTDRPLQLAAQSTPDESGLAFFRTSAGLYIALGLAFVGISLGVWSLASIMAGSEASLEGLLSRYTDGSAELGEDGEIDELIVQSAILQRAVSFSESFAERRGFLSRIEDLLEQANLPIRAGEGMFILVAITVLTAGLGLVLTQSILAALLFGLGAAGAAFFVVRFLGRRRFKAFEAQLPDTLQLLSGTLRAGYSLPQGFEVVSQEIADPMGQELRRAMTEARLGRELEDSLGGVSDRLSSADFAWAVMAISIQREVGGNLSELLDSVADTMIARERLKREISALTAEGRMSAGVLSFLPPGLGLVMWIMNPDYVNLLFTEFLGNILLAAGIVSALVGLAWMKKVITIDV